VLEIKLILSGIDTCVIRLKAAIRIHGFIAGHHGGQNSELLQLDSDGYNWTKHVWLALFS
jgi:hypothetical protein